MDVLELRRSIRACQLCPLHASSSGPVPPEINTGSTALIIGEGPGRREDRQVAPFVGPAGTLLRRRLAELGLGATRARTSPPGASQQPHPEPRPVSFANVVCCWPKRTPPTPSQEEIDACASNLRATLSLVEPRYVLLLGNVALNSFLPTKRIGEWRGMWWKENREEGPRYFLATYHPAAVLRNPTYETPFHDDISSFAFYSLGHFDPPIGEVGKGKRKKNWQQERML